MADYLMNEKYQILEKIRFAKNRAEQVAVCADFYETVQKEESSGRGPLFGWFLFAADQIWFQTEPNEEDAEIGTAHDDASLVRVKAETLFYGDIVAAHLKFTRLVQGLIDIYSNEGYTTAEYHTALWEGICAIPGITSRAAKGICIYAVLEDRRTPYFEVEPGIQMNNKSYLKVTESIEQELAKMQFILALRSSQRTETASRLLSVLEGLDSAEKKTVFLSRLIAAVEPDNS